VRPLRAGAVLALVLATASVAWPQSGTAAPASAAVSALPEPYRKDEFPPWLAGARRFEIISLGAFPILLFYTRLAFDLRRYVDYGFESTYAPWPFRNEASYQPSDQEQVLSILTAAGLSLAFGTVDALLSLRFDSSR
jgi:hypothetical protein